MGGLNSIENTVPDLQITRLLLDSGADVDAEFCKVDIDSNAGLARRFNANAIPLVLLFENGRKVDQKLGAFPEKTYREWIEANL